jgi:hypothetical protein
LVVSGPATGSQRTWNALGTTKPPLHVVGPAQQVHGDPPFATGGEGQHTTSEVVKHNRARLMFWGGQSRLLMVVCPFAHLRLITCMRSVQHTHERHRTIARGGNAGQAQCQPRPRDLLGEPRMTWTSKQVDPRRFGGESSERESRAHAETPFPGTQDTLHSSHTPGGARRGLTFCGESREEGEGRPAQRPCRRGWVQWLRRRLLSENICEACKQRQVKCCL